MMSDEAARAEDLLPLEFAAQLIVKIMADPVCDVAYKAVVENPTPKRVDRLRYVTFWALVEADCPVEARQRMARAHVRSAIIEHHVAKS